MAGGTMAMALLKQRFHLNIGLKVFRNFKKEV